MFSHYGSEHFCPISVVRVFGISLFEEVEQMDQSEQDSFRAQQFDLVDDDRSDVESSISEERLDMSHSNEDSSGNIFTNARDAVINVVRKVGNAFNGKCEYSTCKRVQQSSMLFI